MKNVLISKLVLNNYLNLALNPARYLCLLMAGFVTACTDSGKEFATVAPETIQESLVFNQSAVQRKIDILFVIDNSTSMRLDQEVIGQQFSQFISNISDSDYRIGFINTDVSTPGYESREGFWGNLRAVGQNGALYIDAQSLNPSTLFQNAITLQERAPCPGTTGECHEEPMKAVLMALDKRTTTNAGFFRSDASFVSIIVSDEDELSSGGTNATRPIQFLNSLKRIYKPTGDQSYSSFVIAVPPNDQPCLEEQWRNSASGRGAHPANLLWTLSNFVDGFNVSICNPQMGEEMAKISEFVKAKFLFSKIQLNPPPVSKKAVKIVVKDKNGEVLNIKWKLQSKNVISFEPVPPIDSKVEIVYDRKANADEQASLGF